MRNGEDKFSGEHLRYAGVGFEFAGAVALFTLIGYAIDRHWACFPYGLLTGSLVGIVVGLYLLIKAAIMINADERTGKNDEPK